jgi:hypothetical protein
MQEIFFRNKHEDPNEIIENTVRKVSPELKDLLK